MLLPGHGDPLPAVKALLQHPSVRLSGWVEDIDEEIRKSPIFLVATNGGDYKGSHTRFLHGWSLKACCIGYRYNIEANPEMKDGENVLLADTPDQIVAQIVRAAKDAGLRKKIGDGGYGTYQEFFTPAVVAGRLLAEMQSLVSHRTS